MSKKKKISKTLEIPINKIIKYCFKDYQCEVNQDTITFILDNLQKINKKFEEFPEHELLGENSRIEKIFNLANVFKNNSKSSTIEVNHIKMAFRSLFDQSMDDYKINDNQMEELIKEKVFVPSEIII